MLLKEPFQQTFSRFFLGFGILSLNVLPAIAAEIPQAIIDSAQQRVDFGLNPGIAMIYIESDQAPIIKTFGQNNFDQQAFPITAKSQFEIGSVTKLFTALAAAQAVNSGQISLQESLNDIWPKSWKSLNPSLRTISLSDLLTHTSGLPRMPSNFQPDNTTDPYADYDLNNLQTFFHEYTGTEKQGTYAYSNLAYGLLGAILPQKLGYSSYSEMLEQQIWQKLDMKQTSLDDLENLALSTQPYFEGVPMSKWHWHKSGALAGAGAIRSDAEDMANFLQAQLNPPNNALGKAIKQSHQTLVTPKESPFSMAYAWHISTIAGRKTYWHNGQTGGYLSFIGFDPKTKRGAVVLTNHTDAITDLGLALINPDYSLKPIQDQRRSAQDLAKYLGKYELAPSMIFEVKQANGYLIVQLTNQQALRVFPDGEDRFKYRMVKAQLVFKRNDQGNIIGLTLNQGGEHYAPKI